MSVCSGCGPRQSRRPPLLWPLWHRSGRDLTRVRTLCQLSVMFCGLVGSTELSADLDQEDLRQAVRAYQASCMEIVVRYGGHVVQHLGDSLLVYFGYPAAHGDDAARTVCAGLGITRAVARVSIAV